MFQQRWATCAEPHVDQPWFTYRITIAYSAMYLPKMGHICFVIFGLNVALITRASLGSHLFGLGQKNAYGARSLPEVAHIRMLSGIFGS